MALSVFTSRFWNNPKVNCYITDRGIGVEISLEDFLIAQAEEMKEELVKIRESIGSVSFTFTKKQFDEKFTNAVCGLDKMLADSANRVISKKKQVTAQAVASKKGD